MAPTSPTPRPTWAALALAALGCLFALSLDQATLAQGGLAIVVVATFATVLIGLPIALSAARLPVGREHPGGAVLHGTTEVWTTIAVAAAAAPVIHQLGWIGVLLAVVAWLAAGLAPSLRRLVGAALVIGGVAVSLGMVGLSAVEGPGLSLLEPRWFPVAPWVGVGLLAGLVTASAGLGPIEGSGRRPRGWGVTAGIGLLVLVACVLRVAAPFEAGALEGPYDLGLQSIALVLTPAAILAVGAGGERRMLLACIGLGATLLFAGPAASALPFWWTALLPIGLATLFALRAWLGRGRVLDRVVVGLGAPAALAVPALVGPPLPDPFAAALLALAPVAVVWVAGTRAVLRWRPA